MNLHRHPTPYTLSSRDCWWCRVLSCLERIDGRAEKFLKGLRRFITGGRDGA